jgi:hypothetical protein
VVYLKRQMREKSPGSISVSRSLNLTCFFEATANRWSRAKSLENDLMKIAARVTRHERARDA